MSATESSRSMKRLPGSLGKSKRRLSPRIILAGVTESVPNESGASCLTWSEAS